MLGGEDEDFSLMLTNFSGFERPRVKFLVAVEFTSLLEVVFFFFFFFFSYKACWILAPLPGIKPMPPAVEVWSLNHWTAREVLQETVLFTEYCW